VSWPSGLSFNTTYRTVLSYEFDTGISKLWVSPVNQSSTSISLAGTASATVSVLALFQSFTGESPTPASAQVLDNLVVGNTFEDVLAVPGPTLPGDYNNDGAVNAADYVVWRNGLGTIYAQTDYDVWRTHFGQTTGSGAAGYPLGASAAPLSALVPEPTGLVLAGFGLAAVGLVALRQRQSTRKRSDRGPRIANHE
jgi:hypothetical protein